MKNFKHSTESGEKDPVHHHSRQSLSPELTIATGVAVVLPQSLPTPPQPAQIQALQSAHASSAIAHFLNGPRARPSAAAVFSTNHSATAAVEVAGQLPNPNDNEGGAVSKNTSTSTSGVTPDSASSTHPGVAPATAVSHAHPQPAPDAAARSAHPETGTTANTANLRTPPAQPATVDKPGTLSGKPAGGPAHAGREETAPASIHSLTDHLAPPAANVNIPVHAVAGAHTSPHADAGASSAASSGSGAPPSSRETFVALDAGTGQASSTWIHAGPHSAEAGFEDPTLGWVGVRADLTAGGVHAAVVPASPDAAPALGIHMAGLHAHLNEQRTPVATLSLASATSSSAHSGLNQGMRQGSGQQGGYGGASPSRPNVLASSMAHSTHHSANSAQFASRAGTYISVVA